MLPLILHFIILQSDCKDELTPGGFLTGTRFFLVAFIPCTVIFRTLFFFFFFRISLGSSFICSVTLKHWDHHISPVWFFSSAGMCFFFFC